MDSKGVGRESKMTGKCSVGSGKSSGAAGEEIRSVLGVVPGVREAFGILRESFRGMGKSSGEKRLDANQYWNGGCRQVNRWSVSGHFARAKFFKNLFIGAFVAVVSR